MGLPALEAPVRNGVPSPDPVCPRPPQNAPATPDPEQLQRACEVGLFIGRNVLGSVSGACSALLSGLAAPGAQPSQPVSNGTPRELIGSTCDPMFAVMMGDPVGWLNRQSDATYVPIRAEELGLRPAEARRLRNGVYSGPDIDYRAAARQMIDSGRARAYLDRDGQRLWDRVIGPTQTAIDAYNEVAGTLDDAARTADGIFGTAGPAGSYVGDLPTLGELALQHMPSRRAVPPGHPNYQPFQDLVGSNTVLVVREGDTVVLSFRGSITAGDGWAAAFDQDRFYESVRPLLDAVARYVLDEERGVERVLITGHSLGGAMTEIYAFRDLPALRRAGMDVRAVAYGSPGVATRDAPHAAPARLLVIQGERDNVANRTIGPGPNDLLEIRRIGNQARTEIRRQARQLRADLSWIPGSGAAIGGLESAANDITRALQRDVERTDILALRNHRQYPARHITVDFVNQPNNDLGDWEPQHNPHRYLRFARLLAERRGLAVAPGRAFDFDDSDRAAPELRRGD